VNASGLRALMHRLGGNPFEVAPTVGGSFHDIQLPAIWYPAGMPSPKAFNGLNYSAIGAGEDLLTAVPHIMGRRSGTITKVAQHHGSSAGKIWVAIYRSSSSTFLPTTRVFSVELAASIFQDAVAYTLPTPLTAGQGEILWFATVMNAQAAAGGILNYNSDCLLPIFGTDYDAADSATPPKTFQVGYREAFAYAQPPATWAATGMLASGVGVAMPMFQWAAT
jgi:hypothetical protein